MQLKFETTTHKGELCVAHPDRLDGEGKAFAIVTVYEKRTRYSWNEEYWKRIVNESTKLRPEDAATYGGWPWREPLLNNCSVCGIELPEGVERCPECRRKESFVGLHCDKCNQETPHEPHRRGWGKKYGTQVWYTCTVCGNRTDGGVERDVATEDRDDTFGIFWRPE